MCALLVPECAPDSFPVCSPDSGRPTAGSLDSRGALDAFAVCLGAAVVLFIAAKASDGGIGTDARVAPNDHGPGRSALRVGPPVDRSARPSSVWLLELRETLTPESIAGHARGLEAFGNWCAAEELATAAGFRALRRPHVLRKLVAPFSVGELERLLALVDPRARALTLLLLDTGLGLAEVAGLRVGDLRPDRTIRVHSKGAKERIVPFGTQTWARARTPWTDVTSPKAMGAVVGLRRKTLPGEREAIDEPAAGEKVTPAKLDSVTLDHVLARRPLATGRFGPDWDHLRQPGGLVGLASAVEAAAAHATRSRSSSLIPPSEPISLGHDFWPRWAASVSSTRRSAGLTYIAMTIESGETSCSWSCRGSTTAAILRPSLIGRSRRSSVVLGTRVPRPFGPPRFCPSPWSELDALGMGDAPHDRRRDCRSEMAVELGQRDGSREGARHLNPRILIVVGVARLRPIRPGASRLALSTVNSRL